MSQVSELLKQSMVLHNQAKQASNGQGAARRVTKPRDHVKLREAYELRKQALELDPERTGTAWAEQQASTANGRDTHLMLMAFYRDQGLDG